MLRNKFGVRRIALLAAAGLFIFGGAACNDHVSVSGRANGEHGEQADPRNIGPALYAPKPVPPLPSETRVGAEPVLISAYTSVPVKVDVPSQRDSVIIWIGTELKPGEAPPADKTKYFEYRNKRYRAIEAGERVEQDQVVMLLDDKEAFAAAEAARVQAKSADEVLQKATAVEQSAQKIYAAKFKTQGFSQLELVQALIEWNRAEATEAQSRADLKKAEEDFVQKQVVLEYYTIRSKIPGVVQPFRQTPGGAVKALETVLQIQNADALRAEGVIPNGLAGRLRAGMPVTIEPTIEESPRVHRLFHTQGINGIAVGLRGASQFIVSVSDDKTARVWDGVSDFETATFIHPGPVRSVACSPPAASKLYCLTGGDDGKARLWDLSNPKSTSTPTRVLDGAHKGVVSAVAFSPDGRICATADARDIAIWDVEKGNRKYLLPQHHLGEITSLRFTPQTKLVSASRDNTIRIWSLGQDGGKLDYTHEGRSGDVLRPGVSNDGRYLLADIGSTLRLMTIAEPRTEGVLENINDSSRFSGFALFSFDGGMVVTGSQSEGSISIWRTPTPGKRATELRHLAPRDHAAAFTCAAIAPREENPFAVTGTKNGEIYLWSIPTEKEITKLEGVLSFIDQNSAASTKQRRVWADFKNSTNPPMPVGTNVTIVAEPTTNR
jgi:WD40 repeat protein